MDYTRQFIWVNTFFTFFYKKHFHLENSQSGVKNSDNFYHAKKIVLFDQYLRNFATTILNQHGHFFLLGWLIANVQQQFSQALFTIAVADISMSLDNVVAVAAIAREDTALLVFGLVLAIVLMAFFATIIMRVMTKFPWLSWIGLIFLVYLTIKMLVDGWFELLHIL